MKEAKPNILLLRHTPCPEGGCACGKIKDEGKRYGIRPGRKR